MQLIGLPRAFYQAARLPVVELSPQGKERLFALTAWQALRAKGCTATEACQELGLPRSTMFRWQKRLKGYGPRGVEARSRRPKRVRKPTWSLQLVEGVLRWREGYPRWGKEKLVVLLRGEGWPVSPSTVGRILASLKRRGVLREPPRYRVSASKRRTMRPYALRKPKDYSVRAEGELVQVDSLDLRPLPGVVLKQFTAVDSISRFGVVEVRTRATATTAVEFLKALQRRMPFPIRAIQVDGGSEFMAQFEEACEGAGIRLFVLPPRSPKLNGQVERVNRTCTEEFWECYDGDLDLPTVQKALLAWEQVYNTVRPHQSLAGRTPMQYLTECHPASIPQQSHMY